MDEDASESIIKKHPPKRFQKLEDQQTSQTLSIVKLQEKLDEAEIRRQQVIFHIIFFVFLFLYSVFRFYSNEFNRQNVEILSKSKPASAQSPMKMASII